MPRVLQPKDRQSEVLHSFKRQTTLRQVKIVQLVQPRLKE